MMTSAYHNMETFNKTDNHTKTNDWKVSVKVNTNNGTHRDDGNNEYFHSKHLVSSKHFLNVYFKL